jgi:hypothetical protein
MTVNSRVLLVDPATSEVVAEVANKRPLKRNEMAPGRGDAPAKPGRPDYFD